MEPDLLLDISGRIEWPGLSLEVDIDARSLRIALVGPSGSGKSSLLRCVAGLEPRQQLRVAFNGQVWSDTRVHRASRDRCVGWVPQHAELFPHLSVLGNIAFHGSEEDAHKMAEPLGLEHAVDRSPATLSGGEKQRVALGRALNRSPDLLLLDEPFAALDRPLRARVKDWLLATCEEHDLPFIIVTHDQRDVSDVADEVWEICGGEVSRIEYG